MDTHLEGSRLGRTRITHLEHSIALQRYLNSINEDLGIEAGSGIVPGWIVT